MTRVSRFWRPPPGYRGGEQRPWPRPGALPFAFHRRFPMLAASDVVHVLIDRPLKVAVVIAVAFVANWLVHRAITRFVRRVQGEPAREALTQLVEGQTPTDTQPLRLRRAQRAETVAALLRSMASMVIWVLAFLTVLNQLGIELAPLIAGASMVGDALSFGAQNHVRDFPAGIFILFADKFSAS